MKFSIQKMSSLNFELGFYNKSNQIFIDQIDKPGDSIAATDFRCFLRASLSFNMLI